MENLYKYDFNEKLSIGESALIYYNSILKKDVFNRIIISTILKLHKKGYVELNNTKNNELIIKIKNGTKDLRISEKFIYECLKCIDTDGDSILTLNEFKISENNVFATQKNNIKELIIQEAMKDELIDIKKFKKKRMYFFRTLEILVLIILPIGLEFMDPIKLIMLIIAIVIFSILVGTTYLGNIITTSKDSLKKLKDKLINDDIMQYSSKMERRNIIIEFVICLIVYLIFYYLAIKTLSYIGIIPPLVLFIISIIEYTKFCRTDINTDKAELIKKQLKDLKEYLKEYSLIKDRKAIEVYLWEDYLIFSILLGVNNNVTREISLNLSNDNIKRGIQYDDYENKYFYINDKNEKVYLD